MKKNNTLAATKKARKAFKKELTEKIVTQLKALVDQTGSASKKTNKAIEKASKNLAKKLSKQTLNTTPAEETIKKTKVPTAAARNMSTKPTKAKATPVKKAVEETN